MNTNVEISVASVKVMRSFDYCHFEVCLSSSSADTPEAVDELRKVAARLADKAVAQYQVAKRDAERLLAERQERKYLVERVNKTRAIPEGERTIKQQAELKAYADTVWEERHTYDYEDCWQEEEPNK